MGKVCAKLFQRLNLLIGEGGFHAIVKRSLNLTTSEFPWVTDVKIEQHPACSFRGLHESIEGRDSAEASEGFAAITANIIWLLVTFMGEDLILSLVDDVWPGIRNGEAGQ